MRDSLVAQITTIRTVDGDRYVWPHLLDEVTRALPAYTWLVDLGPAGAVYAHPGYAGPDAGAPAAAAKPGEKPDSAAPAAPSAVQFEVNVARMVNAVTGRSFSTTVCAETGVTSVIQGEASSWRRNRV